jgi:hypothetical protein
MPTPYDHGVHCALADLGLTKQAQHPVTLFYRQRPNPLVQIARRLKKIFKLKIPKFDFAKLIKRLFRNPFRIVGKQLSGTAPPIKL